MFAGRSAIQATLGSSALNDRLSELRAEYIKGRLEAYQPVLNDRVSAVGVGSSVNLVGTGADDPSDALDRRVDFKIVAGCAGLASVFGKPTPAGGNLLYRSVT